MILPKNAQCIRVLAELKDDAALTEWEYEFITSNLHRTEFTDAQRDVIAKLMEKYDFD